MTSALRNGHAAPIKPAMRKQQTWRKALDAILAAPLNIRAASTLCHDILHDAQNTSLAQQANRTLSALRQLQHRPESQLLIRGATRELKTLQSELHTAKRPPFGKFDASRSFSAERHLLGLAAGGVLTAADINAAFRTAANSAHPDHGGSAERFRALVAARDTLLRAVT